MDHPVLLALETSQRQGGVAVRDRTGKILPEPLRCDLRHDDDLLAAVDRVFRRLGLEPCDIDAVGVSTGPGGFTGLRIAVSTAKMLAEALTARVVAVPSALVAAESIPPAGGSIAVALASKGEQIWLTRLHVQPDDGVWAIEGEPGPASASSFDLGGLEALLADRHLPEAARTRCEAAGLAIIDPQFDPAACAAVAARRLQAGLTADPLTLAPIYARPPQAVVQWGQRTQRQQ